MSLGWRLGASLLLVTLAALLLGAGRARALDSSVVRVVYFTSSECDHCHAVAEDVLKPLQERHGGQLEIKIVDISQPDTPGGLNAVGFEMLLYAEKMFDVPLEEQGLPALVVGGEILVGEDEIRERLPCLLDSCLSDEGTAWPDIPGLDQVPVEGTVDFAPGFYPGGSEDPGTCSADEGTTCDVPTPIWAVYFYEVGCQTCSLAEYNIRYVEGQYPHLLVEEHNVQDDAALAEWLGDRLGVPETQRLATPALFIGEEYLIGADITPEAVEALAQKYDTIGAERVWDAFSAEEAEQSIVERFKSFGVFTIVFAGLVDGLNPCAFATIAFFVSYLALSGREGKEILAVGAAFTLGVFLAYLAVGLGFYKVLDLLGGLLTQLGRWVYGLTGLFCAVLAVFSFLDFLKARRGEIKDMALNLPHPLRMRINAVIRKGRGARAFVAGSFVTGVIVSFLELACTGQVYLPTIIFVASQPDLRVRAVLFLLLYNLLFIVPLVVVFVLAYYGTGSKQLTHFLRERTAFVKLGLTVLFAALAIWLLVSVLGG